MISTDRKRVEYKYSTGLVKVSVDSPIDPPIDNRVLYHFAQYRSNMAWVKERMCIR